jgi:hypothetical protein
MRSQPVSTGSAVRDDRTPESERRRNGAIGMKAGLRVTLEEHFTTPELAVP